MSVGPKQMDIHDQIATLAPLVLRAKVDSLGDHDDRHVSQSLLPMSEHAVNCMTTPAGESTRVTTDTKKGFRCTFPGCGREFQLKGNLKRHLNIHNGIKKFACKFCGKQFLRKADMEVHYRVHTGEKPYSCKYQACKKCFARRSDLLSHERTHTGKRPYACAFSGCTRRFARKFNLHKHQRLHESPRDTCKSKTKKRKLKLVPPDKSCDCPRDVAMPILTTTFNPDVLLSEPPVNNTSILTTSLASQTDGTATAGSDTTRYALKCRENHLYSPPACLAAVSSLDAFLLSQETLPFTLDAFPLPCSLKPIGTSCCPAHLELRPPPPDCPAISKAWGATWPSQSLTPTTIVEKSIPIQLEDSALLPTDIPVTDLQPSQTALVSVDALLETGSVPNPSDMPKASVAATYGRDTTSSLTEVKAPASKVCLPTPTSSLLDYSLHNRLCGHLSIQHGNHRDYVVQNHLVCQDSVKRLCAKHQSPTQVATLEPPTCTLPEDTHRRGCGHLPVRHKNHIDYVVEDNLICQQASWLEDDHLELLGDDFWDFYEAIDAFPTI